MSLQLADNWLGPALAQLARGGIVAVGTESYFALAVDATSSQALDRLFEVKVRDPKKGVGLLVPPGGSWRRWVQEPPARAEELAARHWPGPLSLVLAARSELDSRLVVDGGVALRVPGPSPAFELTRAWAGPLTATSANLAGHPPCRTSQCVREAFAAWASRLHVVEGSSPGGMVSTLVRITDNTTTILRFGAVSEEDLAR